MNEISRNLKHLMENRTKLPEEGFIELISKILKPIENIGWELGPDIDNENKTALSLSVGFDKNNVQILEKKLELPIYGVDWSIVIGIPPKDWQLFFIVKGSDGAKYEIDGANWRFVDTWSESKARIELIPPSDWSFSQEITYEVMKIILVGSLGELNVVDFISSYNLKDNINEDTSFRSVKELRQQFLRNVTNCHYSKFLKSQNVKVVRS